NRPVDEVSSRKHGHPPNTARSQWLSMAAQCWPIGPGSAGSCTCRVADARRIGVSSLAATTIPNTYIDIAPMHLDVPHPSHPLYTLGRMALKLRPCVYRKSHPY